MKPMDEIYQKYAQTVYRYLLSLTRDPDLSEELTQETFYQAIRSSNHYDESCQITTWLCGIARNVLRTWQRKHPLTASLDELPESPAAPSASSAEDTSLREMDRIGLLRSVHELPEPCREVMYLRIFGDLSFREIGEILSKTENWARVTFYRGKEKLKPVL